MSEAASSGVRSVLETIAGIANGSQHLGDLQPGLTASDEGITAASDALELAKQELRNYLGSVGLGYLL
ncbi:MAG TPA: hypothetical protein VMR45_03840 [Patescibacteria group bacterium]|nr:hypothetical protein [Patescibacteria group bacterium]